LNYIITTDELKTHYSTPFLYLSLSLSLSLSLYLKNEDYITNRFLISSHMFCFVTCVKKKAKFKILIRKNNTSEQKKPACVQKREYYRDDGKLLLLCCSIRLCILEGSSAWGTFIIYYTVYYNNMQSTRLII
jgi:hypothetical protein